MSAYSLIGFKTCPWVQRVAIVLREKNAPFTSRYIESNNRPDWFLAISPHKKVPVLRIDDSHSLFESNAITEFLDETLDPPLHPGDPFERALNRAWNDYLPTFAKAAAASAHALTEEQFKTAIDKTPAVFARLERALEDRNAAPFFNGTHFSLVDASYAPFLQRYFLLDEIRPQGVLESFPRLKAWGEVLVARPSTHSFPPNEFDVMYRESLGRRGAWLSQFVQPQMLATG